MSGDNKEHLQPTIEEIRRVTLPEEKVAKLDPYTRYFIRKFSIYISWLLLRTPVTANQVTLLWGAVFLIASLCFLSPNPLYGFGGALLLQLWYILDCVDGDIARFRKTASTSGVFLDMFLHVSIHPLLFLCMAFGAYNLFYSNIYLVAGIIMTVYYTVFSVVRGFLCQITALTEFYKSEMKTIAGQLKAMDGKVEIKTRHDAESLERLDFLPSKGLKTIIYLFINLSDIVSIMNILFFITLLDIFVQPFFIAGYIVNFKVIFIAFYSIFFFVLSFVMGTFYFIKKSPDRSYMDLLTRFYIISKLKENNEV